MSEVPEGVIIPPPDIRKAVETTVGYTERNGQQFIQRILKKEESNPKFSFLKEQDVYHPYYQWYVQEYREGRGRETGSKSSGSSKQKQQLQQHNGSETPVEEFEFAFDMPPISAQDLDIIKITALHVAQHGDTFLKQLREREQQNFQFEFLKDKHSLHSLFTHFVDQYKKVMSLDTNTRLQSKLQQGIDDKYAILESAKNRAEQRAQKKEQDRQNAEQLEKERIEYAQIDWHDFVVVQTVEFTNADYRSDLPAAVSLAQLQYASLEQKRKGTFLLEEAAPDFDPSTDSEPPAAQNSPAAQPQGSAPTSASQSPAPESSRSSLGPPPNVKVKPKGTRRERRTNTGQPLFISPLTNEPVPESQYNEHMRISQLDPKYKQFKQVEAERNATSNLTEADAEANLKRLYEQQDSDRRKKSRNA